MSEEKKKTSLPEQEEEILKFWESNQIFEKSLERRRKSPRFVFYDGPPFATGLPHYGHILASTIKDVVPRYFTMKGYRVERRWGWDCHGLPIENIVEQNLKISGRKSIERYGLKNFNEAARSVVLTYADEWRKTIRRIGRFVDFDNSYKTMDPEYMESVWWAFSELNKKGLLYQDARVSLFCSRCETPLSNFEIAMDNSYRDREDESVFVKFYLSGKPQESVLIWTTTPWTLPGNAGVAVNPEIEYTKYKISSQDGEEFVWSGKIPPHEPGREPEPVEKEKGRELIGWKYEPPFKVSEDEWAYKIVAADFVDMAEGTGLVHTAPAFGEEDFQLGRKEKLPVIDTLDSSGRFNSSAKTLAFLLGRGTGEANKLIIAFLKNAGYLWKSQKIAHRYPVCWRCSTPLIYKIQPAWFVKISALKEKMLKENEKIDWHPEHLKHGRFGNGLKTAPEWNVSRSRFWGTPLPVWECGDCGKFQIIGGRDELADKSEPGKNKYFLMRHGQSLGNVENIASCRTGEKYPLTVQGKTQAEKSAQKLKSEKIDFILSSPVRRARETAEITAKILGVKIEMDERLREIEFGILDGEPSLKYSKFFSSFRSRFHTAPPGGENVRELRTRVFDLLKELEDKYAGKKILLVGHEYPLWMIYSAARGLSDEEARREKNKRGDFLNYTETAEVVYRQLPRNDSGEIDFHRPYADEIKIKCACGGQASRIPDVFDCWFESGSMPFAEKHYPYENKKIFEENFPADFISEYVAQTRGWFYTLHVLATALFQKPSFKHVVTTGTIMSEKGEKLSKSRKNFPDPWILFGRYGVDAMRFYLMSSPIMQADNVNFSEKDVDEVYKKFSLIAYNVLNFYKLYEHKVNSKLKTQNSKANNILDRWILSRLHNTIAKVTENYDRYEIVQATRPLLDFVQDLSLWYVRRSRERVKEYSGEAEKAVLILRKVIYNLSLLIAPTTPFLAEILYQGIGAKEAESVHLDNWPRADKKRIDGELEKNMAEIRQVVSEALRLRAEAGIKIRQPLGRLQVKSEKLKVKPELLQLIKDEVNVKEITFGSELKLDTSLNNELREEGIAREFIRNVQDLRKDLGLKPQDKIFCQVSGARETEAILEKRSGEIKKAAGLSDFKIGGKKEFRAEKEIDFDGKTLWVGIR